MKFSGCRFHPSPGLGIGQKKSRKERHMGAKTTWSGESRTMFNEIEQLGFHMIFTVYSFSIIFVLNFYIHYVHFRLNNS